MCALFSFYSALTFKLSTIIQNHLRARECSKYSTYSETMSLNGGSLTMTGIDLGGHRQVRRVWQDYYQSVDTVVFMVDAADPSRLPEAREELKRVLTDHQLADRPIAVLANKVDAQVSDSHNYRIFFDNPLSSNPGQDRVIGGQIPSQIINGMSEFSK